MLPLDYVSNDDPDYIYIYIQPEFCDFQEGEKKLRKILFEKKD